MPMFSFAYLFVIFFNIIFLCPNTFAETHIGGDISEMRFDTHSNPYIVESDLVVQKGKKTVIPAGIIFLFKPFTGINVNGTLRVEGGTSGNEVVFTTINDTIYNQDTGEVKIKPNPFDWNGIRVLSSSAAVYLENFILSYSVYGIQSETDDISVVNGVFRQNGQYHFTTRTESGVNIFPVVDNVPFTCKNGSACLNKKAILNMEKNTSQQNADANSKGIILITSGTGAAVFGVSALGIGIWRAVLASAAYDSAGMAFPDEKRDDYYYSQYKKYYIQSLLSFVGSGVCAGASAYLFYVQFKSLKKQVTFIPYYLIDGTTGITMGILW
ncbi:MAG: hypothetical protein N2053_00865 [Chitinispirillaceae bacterium]|nr:hypothetical protein [Chitinispirillaceae bacterium]